MKFQLKVERQRQRQKKSIIEDGIELSKSTAVNEFVCVFAFFSYSFSNVNQIRAKKTQIFRFFSVTRFFFVSFLSFFLHFATAFVGKNARKLLTIFLNDEIHFLVSFLP